LERGAREQNLTIEFTEYTKTRGGRRISLPSSFVPSVASVFSAVHPLLCVAAGQRTAAPRCGAKRQPPDG
jgi:hypothetical protein